ncbi:N-hydroxyarylamine O-acetyltransferase [Filomicrobium insigne]|uniref:N-hydroxyarylamine O-acetyltransferase n=1 Tax=Filomicrobium insigne TaxID=418854 RepID=A0A1H0QQ39_9HYPH|nr:arylamine N-acetyltransferase [Filomicrobium insigne]SDP19290.1 N-hydroxyarylamine O-acetyltransferase [Filomicrobium insigne]
MEANLDLGAYFKRINYSGPDTPSLETLRTLQAKHTAAIAFENLDSFLGRQVFLNISALQSKLVHGRRGGYCFEQNTLLASVLKALGYKVRGLAARVLWNQPPGTVVERSHMLLFVEIQETPYIVDVGFGGNTPTAPLRLEADIEQSTPNEPFRLTEAEGDWILELWDGREWRSIYRFDLQGHYPPDYEVSNYYVSTHPASPFRRRLIASRPIRGVRYALANNRLTLHRFGQEPERHFLETVSEMRHALETIFLLALPRYRELDEALAGVLDSYP